MNGAKVMTLENGYVQVYTGNGKGKTTAAAGLAIRALAAGLKVCLISFLKGETDEGEFALLNEKFDGFTMIGTGTGELITGEPADIDLSEAKRALFEAKKAMDSKNYDLVILEEVNAAVGLELVSLNEILDIIKNKPQNIELVLTGSGAKEEVIDAADLVTDMTKVKHYFEKGVAARDGIEK